jgi:hypothetical protein
VPAFVAGDSYTTQTRVESLVQRGTFTTASRPTAQQVLDFMALRGAEVTAALARAGYGVSPPTIADSTIARLADLANAMLAAGDAIQAHDVKDEKLAALSEQLWAEGRKQLDAAIAFAASTLTGGGSVRSATSTGGITKADFTDGGGRSEREVADIFTMDTRN